MTSFLPFHNAILERIHDPSTSELLILARGLGLRRIICTLMKIYDSPQNLVLLVNASLEEDSAIGAELGIMGCRRPGLRIIGYEMGRKERKELYRRGGLMSVTSRILVVDMLQSDIPMDLISGIIMLHAEKVTAVSLEAFIVRLYREKNTAGFLKAFSDQPEHITTGLSPLKSIMKELQIRSVHIYPRFHQDIQNSLEKRKVEVIELYQHLTTSMYEIHTAIMQCMTTTLSELKRSNSTLDLDDITIENAYFRSFDILVRRQLDPVWHKVGPKTKQLVNDLSTLRRLLTYLLTYDAVAFHAYLEVLIASNTVSASGGPKQHQSPWLLTEAANTIFTLAKRRCFVSTPKQNKIVSEDQDEHAWEALDDIQDTAAGSGSKVAKRRTWLPDGMDPVLEELPKWTLLAAILHEIEEEQMRQESLNNPRSNAVLVMTNSTRSATLIQEFLASMDPDALDGTKGKKMMEDKLRLYLWWKRISRERNQGGKTPFSASEKAREEKPAETTGRSEGLKLKDQERVQRAVKRRRIRGGAPASGGRSNPESGHEGCANSLDAEGLLTLDPIPDVEPPPPLDVDVFEFDFSDGFDEHYGLLAPKTTVLVRAYLDDGDDQVLAEIKPSFVVMFEPNEDFIRRIEVFRCLNPRVGVRVYHMLYKDSCEEHKLLSSMRREKGSFERLIKERGTMLLPIMEDIRANAGDQIIKTISSRLAGGRQELSTRPSQVVVDLREFRSTLPSLLHASKLRVIPATLTVGDYILSPTMCVERKSLADLTASFNSGRLYTQCELMSVHYKQPILLIEFEEHKSFSLKLAADMKSYAKPTGKYPPKKTGPESAYPPEYDSQIGPTIQSKLVLLTLAFPRVRIIWSSSPYATADIFNSLKLNQPEPDPAEAISVGGEAGEGDGVGVGVNAAGEELLGCLPGITAKNVRFVMGKVGSVRGLCEMSMKQVQEVLGVEPGNACYNFIHKGERRGC